MTAAATAAKSPQSCLTLCDPIDGSPPGCPIPGILQARTLEWVAFSNAWKWKVKVKSLSRVRLLATPWTATYQVPPTLGFSKQEYWSGMPLPSPQVALVLKNSPANAEDISESESCSVVYDSLQPHGLYSPWNHQARILEWVTFPFSRGSSQPRDWTQVSRIAGGILTCWATREAQEYWSGWTIPSPGDLPNPEIKLGSSALQADSLPTELSGKPQKT